MCITILVASKPSACLLFMCLRIRVDNYVITVFLISFHNYIYIYILEIWGCELVKAPRNREMLCKRCECVSERECRCDVRVCLGLGCVRLKLVFVFFFAPASAPYVAYVVK